MREISAEIRLRPTRIGFLVRPTDFASVRAIMRTCTCLWGGVYNPIIPVFRTYPLEWRPESFERTKAKAVAAGYVKFFEPDAYVEAETGLLEEAGLGALREKYSVYPHVVPLDSFLTPEQGRNWGEPALGLNIYDVLQHVYETEQKFVRREPRENLLIASKRGDARVEAMFGAYPESREIDYIREGYEDVFKAQSQPASPEVWLKAYIEGANTPLRITAENLDRQRYWYHDLVIFIFDPTKPTDLIDLWNMRLEPSPVVPVPVDWFIDLSRPIIDLLKSQYRPIVGNPQGLMHNATVEFARSIPRQQADDLIEKLRSDLPAEALSVKHWRTPIWVELRFEHAQQEARMKISADSRRLSLPVKSEQRHTTNFPTLAPTFSDRLGRGDHRWVNTFSFTDYEHVPLASLLPFNTFDRSWPHVGLGGEPIAVGSEGWVFPQHHKGASQYVTLLTSDEAISGSLERSGISSSLSEPGHIAKQMLEQLGGLWGVHLLADIETLQFLNKMAGGVRKRRNGQEIVEETFELRAAPLKDWTDLIARRTARRSLPTLTLERFTKANIIRLGLETDCPHCHARNWNTLKAVDYQITCERCLKLYEFPQADLRDHNKNWTYRVVGPFSVPDFARGSYCALLTLRVLDRFRSSMRRMTFATASTLKFDGIETEIDFAALSGEERMEWNREPTLVIGEAKSFGQDAIKAIDLKKLKTIAAKLPDAVIVISILRDHFTPKEKELLKKFVTWSRRLNAFGQPSNPVLLLTSRELMMGHYISTTWKALGPPYDKFSDYNSTSTLRAFGEATQQIYLGIDSFYKWRDAQWRKRDARKSKKTKSPA